MAKLTEMGRIDFIWDMEMMVQEKLVCKLRYSKEERRVMMGGVSRRRSQREGGKEIYCRDEKYEWISTRQRRWGRIRDTET